ncbi:MAG: quinone-dependent dihydroorotate dehydrogenase [Pseudomonadota bacterium]
MLSFISFLLLKLPPETAHALALFLLRIYQFIRTRFFSPIELGSFLIKIPPRYEIKLRSRLGLAAGFDKNAEVFPALLNLGFGFVEVGTVTPLPQGGNPPPRIWRVAPQALVNHMGFNSVGLKEFHRNLKKHKSRISAPVFANIGKNKATPIEDALSDYEQCIGALRNLVSGFVVNISSPNTPGLRELQSMSFLQSLAPILPSDKPTFIKLAPDLTKPEFEELCDCILSNERISGVVLTNTSRALSEIRGFSKGGLSGPPLLSTSLDWVEKARSIFKGKKMIIGVGGVSSLDEAQKMREAGADLVEIYTAFIYQGPKLVKEITKVF